ncbi:MAG TPA: CBS domain-containing protein [Nitrososphaerales archaeon]
MSELKIDEMVPDLGRSLQVVKEEDPLRIVMAHLRSLDASSVVVTDKGGKPVGTIGGFNVLFLIASGPFDPYTSIQNVMAKFATWPPPAVPKGTALTVALDLMKKERLGHVVILGPSGEPVGLVGLIDIARFLARSGINELGAWTIGDLALALRRVVETTETFRVADSIRLMVNNDIRRLYVRSLDVVLSDRSLVNWLLEEDVMAQLRKVSDIELLATQVRELKGFMHAPGQVRRDTSLAEALKVVVESESRCALVDNARGLVTPEDLVLGLHGAKKQSV